VKAHPIVQWARGLRADEQPHHLIDAKLSEALDPIYALEAETSRLREQVAALTKERDHYRSFHDAVRPYLLALSAKKDRDGAWARKVLEQ
jgi:hypothetical protein